MNFNTKIIREERQKNNISQNKIADQLKVSRSSYAMWESNNNIFPIKRLIEVCNILNITLDYALGFSSIHKLNKESNIQKSANRIKELRKDNNLTQEKLAQFLNTNKTVICNYERGRNLIGTPFLYMICKKYKVSADYLLGRSDSPKYLK